MANIFHGITLAQNSVIKNLKVEVLTTDPSLLDVQSVAGRIWYNSTDKSFKSVTLDENGNRTVRSLTFDEVGIDLVNRKVAEITTGTGLTANGEYVANSSTTYTGDATSLKQADELLDSAIVAERARAVAAEESIRNEVLTANGEIIKTLAGLLDVDSSDLADRAMMQYDADNQKFVFVNEVSQPEIMINGGNF